MRLFIILVGILFSNLSLAATDNFTISGKLFIDGKLVSSPQIITKAGEKATVMASMDQPYEDLSLSVLATPYKEGLESGDGIMMKFDISYKAKGMTVNARPQIMAASGQEASITSTTDNDVQYELIVTARKNQ